MERASSARKAGKLIAAPLAALVILGAACTDNSGNLREAVITPPSEGAPAAEPAAQNGADQPPAPSGTPPREQDAPPQGQEPEENAADQTPSALSIAALSLCGEEYVEITNGSDAAIELDGWTLQDASGAALKLPSATLQPNASTRVYTGDAPQGAAADALAIGRGQGIWNDNGDTATLLDPDGDERGSRSADECLVLEEGDALMMMQMETPTVATPGAGGDLRIAEVAASGDEYIVLTNADTEPIQLLGWVLRDSTSRNRLEIETARLLMPGQSVRVYNNSLPADAPAGSIAASGPRRVWNDGGDTVRLISPGGGDVHRIVYTGSSWTAEDGDGTEAEGEQEVEGGQTGMLEIVSVDARNEIVVIRNADDEAVNLAGWLLRDSTSRNRLRLPAHTLPPGAQVRVYSSELPPGAPANAIAGDGPANIWNNDGDSVRLIDPSGRQIDRVEYTGAVWPEPPSNDRVVSPPRENPRVEAPVTVITYPTTLEITVVSPCSPEYVALRNTGTAAIQLQNWMLRDDSNNTLMLPQHSLAAESEVRVYTRTAPASTATTISIKRGQGIWNDRETDTANLLNPAGVRLTSETFNGCLRTETEREPEMPMDMETMTAGTRTHPHAPQIVEVQARGEEYITLRSTATINLRGWMLSDGNPNHLLTLPEHTLEPGSEVLVYTRSTPTSTVNTISIGRGSTIWNDGGDTVILFDPNDVERGRVMYTGGTWSIDDAMEEDEPEEMEQLPTTYPYAPQIVEVQAREDEYITLRNTATATINLQGWVLRDSTMNHLLTIGTTYELESGTAVRVYTRSAPTGTVNTISINRGSTIWNDGGDTVRLLDPNEVERDRVVYTGGTWSIGTAATSTTLEIAAVSPCNPEYVALRNTGRGTIQLHDLMLRDDSPNNRLKLPRYSLDPADDVLVYTRSAPTGTVNTISINRGQGIWNDNETDTAHLLSPAGMRLANFTFNGCLRTKTEEKEDEPGMAETHLSAPLSPHPYAPQIVEIQAGAEDEDDEYITLRNTATATINLQGWTFRDRTLNNKLRISEYALALGEEVRVYTRSLPTTPTVNVAATTAAGPRNVWNKTSDDAILLDPSGQERDRVQYAGTQWSINSHAQEMPYGLRITALHLCFDESVEITNGGAAVNLDGWRLRDKSGTSRAIPAAMLQPGAIVRVYTEAPPDDAPPGSLTLSYRWLWNNPENKGDTAELLNPDGQVVHSFFSMACPGPLSP